MASATSASASNSSAVIYKDQELIAFERQATKEADIFESFDEECDSIVERLRIVCLKDAAKIFAQTQAKVVLKFPIAAIRFPASNTPVKEAVGNILSKFFNKKITSTVTVPVDEWQYPEDNQLVPWLVSIRTEARLFCAHSLGMQIVPLADRLTPEEVMLFGFPYDMQLNITPAELSCFQYALLKVQENRIIELNDSNNAGFLNKLQEWGYENVKAPRKGDLVLYMQDEVPSHLGVYLGDGWVESKPGNKARYAFKHRLLHTWKEYGNQYAFFRPPLVRVVQKSIQQAKPVPLDDNKEKPKS